MGLIVDPVFSGGKTAKEVVYTTNIPVLNAGHFIVPGEKWKINPLWDVDSDI